jgi:hypothetical protein
MTASLQQLTWLASAPFRAQHQLVSGRLSRALPRRGTDCCLRVPAAFRPPAFASRPSFPAWCSAPLTIGLPPGDQLPPADHDGFPCFARARRGRVRAPSIPRGQRCLHEHVCVPCPPPAALQRPVPVTPVSRPVPECLSHEASARVHWRSPLPAIPLACSPRTEREPLGFPRASHPAGQDPAAHAGAGTGLRHWPGITPSPSATSYGAFTHHERLHVATHLRGVLSAAVHGSFSNSHCPSQRAPFASTRPDGSLFTRWIEAKAFGGALPLS